MSTQTTTTLSCDRCRKTIRPDAPRVTMHLFAPSYAKFTPAWGEKNGLDNVARHVARDLCGVCFPALITLHANAWTSCLCADRANVNGSCRACGARWEDADALLHVVAKRSK